MQLFYNGSFLIYRTDINLQKFRMNRLCHLSLNLECLKEVYWGQRYFLYTLFLLVTSFVNTTFNIIFMLTILNYIFPLIPLKLRLSVHYTNLNHVFLNSCLDVFNFLKLNDDKTEFIILGSKHQIAKLPTLHLSIGTSQICPSDKVRNLGAIFDTNMTLQDHITHIAKCSSFQLRNIGFIRKYLNQDAAEQLIHAFVTSRLDMGNSLLFGLPDNQIKRLSRLQNIAARIITRTKPRDHITPVLRELHWLPIADRIVFKILVYVYRSTTGSSPSYIKDCLVPYKPNRYLRSGNKSLFIQPRTFTSWGQRSFLFAAPFLWNKLPDLVKSASSLNSFKSQLKTLIMNSESNYFTC